MSNAIIICGRCHKSGHRAAQCSEAPAGNAAQRGERGPPPSPCWTRELIAGADPNHWGDECPVAAERLKNRECTLCGSKEHWKKGCPNYQAGKHTARNPRTTYFPTQPRQANITWCLKCGIKGAHATVDCQKDSPAILFPSGDDKEAMEGICTFCAIRGHTFSSCMRRAPQQADANKMEIDKLSLRVDALSKSVDKVNELDSKVRSLRSDVLGLTQWKATSEATQDDMKKQLATMETWRNQATSQISQCVTHSKFDVFVASRYQETEKAAQRALSQSAFDDWVKNRYEEVARKAQQAVSQSTFDDYVSCMEASGYSPESCGDASMAPARVTGASRIASERDDLEHGGPAQRAKRNVARRGASENQGQGSQPNHEAASSSGTALSSAPGAAVFGEMPPPPGDSPWLRMVPESKDPWENEALSVLLDVWTSHMDSRLQQWMSRHASSELATTAQDLARSPMSPTKRNGICAILRGALTPVRVFTNLNV